MSWVNDSIYAAGGDHIPATWGAFSSTTGISAVLTMSAGRPVSFTGPPPARFLWISVGDERETDTSDRYLAGAFLTACIEEGRRVLIHCPHGRHRTRWAYVAYALAQGRKLKTVLNEAAGRPWLGPYSTDQQSWEAYSAWLKSRV